MQLAVRVVEHRATAHLQHFAGGGKFFSPHCSQLGIAFGPTAVSSGLPRREADHRGFYSTRTVQQKRATEAAGFVVGMSRHHHHAQHELIVAPCNAAERFGSREARPLQEPRLEFRSRVLRPAT